MNLNSFIIYKRTIIFFNYKISPLSKYVETYHPYFIGKENDLPKFTWLTHCQCLDIWIRFLARLLSFIASPYLSADSLVPLLFAQYFRQLISLSKT